MDIDEARKLLAEKLSEYRTFSYTSLVNRIGDDDYLAVTGPSWRTEYQIEVQFLWDAEPKGNLRVSAAIDDGSFRHAFSPQCEDFVISPDGRMMGMSHSLLKLQMVSQV